MSGTGGQIVGELTKAVLIVEDEEQISSYFASELDRLDIPVFSVDSIAGGIIEIANLLSQEDLECIVILLDLMFEDNDPKQGLNFLRKISQHQEFQEGKINVIVRTASLDQKARKEALDAGAKEFHTKGRGPDAALQDILFYLGLPVLTTATLMEVVDIDNNKREADVRYRADNNNLIRCTLDFQIIPAESRVPGGSFRFEIYKQLVAGQAELRTKSRAVDKKIEASMLEDLLGR